MVKNRLIFNIILSITLLYVCFQTKYNSIYEITLIISSIVYLILAIINLSLLIRKKDKRNLIHLSFNIFCLILAGILKFYIHYEYTKPSLIKAFYDGDYNGIGIDLKKDGSYIFDDSAIGISSFHYGIYLIKDDIIILTDPNNRMKVLEIQNLKFVKENNILYYI